VHKFPPEVRAPSIPVIDTPPSLLAIGGKPHRAPAPAPDAHTHTLVRRYALTGATCVRAYDYLRRYFVLRICADGQQLSFSSSSTRMRRRSSGLR
jgi:hypothetical protein